MSEHSPERLVREVVESCGSCQYCKEILKDMPCQFLPELFRLLHREKELGEPITAEELTGLVVLCNACGLCPCPSTRNGIRHAREALVEQEGLPAGTRFLLDVQRIGALGAVQPRLANLLLDNRCTARALKALTGIHQERVLPRFPPETFISWARRRGLHRKRGGGGRKVAYYPGCVGEYFFPEDARATVEVLEQNGVEVYVPELRCCGMPTLLEGDRAATLAAASHNLERLDDAVAEGYEIVCSCPACGHVLRGMFSEGAYYSDQYRAWLTRAYAVLATEGIDAARQALTVAGDGRGLPAGADAPPWMNTFFKVERPSASRNGPPMLEYHIVHGLIRDQSYFAPLDAWKRIRVSSHTYDLSEYLLELDRAGQLNRELGPVAGRMAYFPPCHLREQNVGQPWRELLGLVPGMSLQPVGGVYDCCGMGGIMGLKREFHESSVAMGRRLAAKIQAAAPDRVVTECQGCRVQFLQTIPQRTCHPVEILRESYESYREA
jgi:glycerol-3-phosphate dehydrogenase subunit C